MGAGEVLIIIGAIVIAFSSVTAIGAISGKLEGVVTIQEKFLVTIFLFILLIMGWVLLYNGILIIICNKMGKRLSLEDKAKIANGNERHCRQCNHRVCPDGLLEVCSEAFIRGYKKGYKQNQKEQKERIDKILHPVTEPCGSNAIFVFFRDVRSGELQPYIEDMRMPDAKRYQDIGSIRFSQEKDEPQKLQIAWCYPKDLVELLGYDKKYADFERIALSEGAFSYPREEYEENLQKYSALRHEHKKYYRYRKFKK